MRGVGDVIYGVQAVSHGNGKSVGLIWYELSTDIAERTKQVKDLFDMHRSEVLLTLNPSSEKECSNAYYTANACASYLDPSKVAGREKVIDYWFNSETQRIPADITNGKNTFLAMKVGLDGILLPE